MAELRRVIITGGAGFLGSHLCDRLVASGCEVLCMDNLLTGAERNIVHLLGHPRFQFIKYDVCDYIYVERPVDAVLHFASPASPKDYLEYPIHTLKVGAFGTHKALGLARAKGARFLLASTSKVYGDPLVNPQPETYWGNVNPISPRGVYDEARRFAEAMTMAYHRYYGCWVGGPACRSSKGSAGRWTSSRRLSSRRRRAPPPRWSRPGPITAP